MMPTPICDFVKDYAARRALRLHMPGHKGENMLGVESLDITEIAGADVLYSAKGIIRQSEQNAAALYDTAATIYSAEGSSLAIRAMLYLAMLHAKSAGNVPHILAGRNAHKTFLTGVALLDVTVDWLFPETQESLMSCEITPERLETAVIAMPTKPTAVYITSPDYLGHVADIAGIAAVCRRHDMLLLVDNAHGAYLQFLPESRHPIALGADMCSDSAHKTLPVLTGGAYLHIAKSAPAALVAQAEQAMSLFASTSPSYLILQSLDAANRYLADGYREKLAEFVEQTKALKQRLATAGYSLIGDEPLKLTIAAKPYGYTGYELSALLAAENIVDEFCDPDFTVMMLTPEIGEEGLTKIEQTLMAVPPKSPMMERMPPLCRPVQAMSAREALFSAHEVLPVREAVGRVLASATVSCPPAIPVVVCGEVIDESAQRVFAYYGIDTCQVVKR